MRNTTTTRVLPSKHMAPGVVPGEHQSLLSVLRSVTPIRALHLSEALRVAELQANKLLEYFGIDEPSVPSELILRQPRMHVVSEEMHGTQASGSSHWDGSRWIIVLNGAEPLVRQRFSLFHEYKHIVDDRFRGLLYADERSIRGEDKAERVADYFAACVLMPKRLVKRYFCSGITDLAQLGELFEVSDLAQLGELFEVSERAMVRVLDRAISGMKSWVKPQLALAAALHSCQGHGYTRMQQRLGGSGGRGLQAELPLLAQKPQRVHRAAPDQ